jgi:DNA-directed RNA polymerase specialized sigma subunit
VSTPTPGASSRPRRSRKAPAEGQPPATAPAIDRFPPPTAWSEQLAADNLRLAANRARRLHRLTLMPYDDLLMVAWVGLLKACRYYDPKRINPTSGAPYRLSTCAVPFIDGAMWQWLRKVGHPLKIPNKWRELGPKVRRMAAMGRTADQIEQEVGLPADEVRELIAATGPTAALRQDIVSECSGSGGMALDDDEVGQDPANGTELLELVEIARRAWSELNSADRLQLEASWLAKRRRQVATLPLGQFRARVRRVVGHSRAPGGTERTELGFEVETTGGDTPGRPRGAVEQEQGEAVDAAALTAKADQLGLFDSLAT